ncbi:RecQ mediated genome instability protein [Nitzschia inconspicua]|uniref:RecQ mediated genome instability protein n=1 Tax=Nitzschia inconspicua TaxID=303405 RepID=A0A9K3LIX7_9STRA|nr:RecQ mediated genome instability protein [Nitzschia inconspicua]
MITSSQLNEAESIQRQCLQTLGVHPSQDWLQACISHLNSSNSNNGRKHHDHPANANVMMMDRVLHQLLHADLRDVVRRRTSSSSSTITANNSIGGFQTAASALSSPISPAAQLLQHALQQSRQQQPYKQVLPATFLLLCQMEEVCDACLPAEKRLEVAVVSSNPSSSNHSSPNRCLKLCLTDGYAHNCNNSIFFVGVETQAPIPNLSATSLAGLKLLLKGSIVIRHGQLLLDPSTCIVIGGHVDALVAQQQQALQKAKQAAGVGIDPTIRALIGTGAEAENDNDENEDEAHEASGDVQPAPMVQVPEDMAPSTTTRSSLAAVHSPAPRQPPATTTTARSAWAPSNSSAQRHHYSQQVQPQQSIEYQRQRLQPQPQRTPPTVATNPTVRRPVTNPYFSGSPVSSSSSATTTTNPYAHKRTAQLAATVTANPYSHNASAPTIATTIHTDVPPNTAPPPNVSNPNEPSIMTETATSSTKNIQIMSLPNLCTLLSNLLQSKEMYESYCQQQLSFRVQLIKDASGPITFNVVKNRNYCKKDPTSQKYEYFIALVYVGMDQQHQHQHQTDAKVACRIHPSCIDPHFEVSAANLRAMTRTNREHSQHIINQGGEKVKEHYFCACAWTASLHLPAAEVWEGNKSVPERLTDLNHPILLLQDPERISS